MLKKADLSIIITNYNKPNEQIEECIESVLAQTVEAKEVFLIDDGSKQPVSHSKVLSVIFPENRGVAKARDFGFKLSTGKLILFVDADDVLPWDFVQKCGEKITQADIVYPDLLYFGAIKHKFLKKLPDIITKDWLFSKEACLPVTSMMKREVYKNLGGFKELSFYEDWDFFMRAFLNNYYFVHANTYLMYRQSRKNRMYKTEEEREKLYQNLIKQYKKKK